MTEPVAYMWKTVRGTILGLKPNDDNHSQGVFGRIPLYTAQQLHQRVKMTQAEFDEFKKLLSVGISTIYEAFDVIDSDRGEMDEFEQLYNRLFTNSLNQQAKQQIEFAKLWDSLSTCSADETIEIVPDKKWFVRNKQKGKDDVIDYLMIDDDVWFGWHPFVTRDEATAFDTKEEAEKWTNPLTEAVQLPVEE